MNQNNNLNSNKLGQFWHGLGGWNYYFLLKFGLLWFGYLNFHPLANLVFMAFLLLPIPSLRLQRMRNIIALPLGLGLFYHDTWLPGINSILSQGALVAQFSPTYLLELAQRFINWQMVGAAFVLFVAYLFIAQWLRVTLFTVLAMAWLNLSTLTGPAFSLMPAPPTNAAATTPAVKKAPDTRSLAANDSAPANNQNLSAYLEQFYLNEKQRITAFPSALPADAQPFDLLIINICSLAWSDLETAKLLNHPLWAKMDLLFDNFNSATSYSGPAAIRLLRASCGQPAHHDLYNPPNTRCLLFDNLAKLGFSQQLMLDHSGEFGNYLKNLREQGNMQAPLMAQSGIGHTLASFDGEPIYDDLELLQRWLKQQQSAATRTATFFNVIPLHDGNRFVGSNKSAPYPLRAQKLFDQLNQFIDQLDKAGRRVMIVLVPEHGGALTGDKMQMSGLRDIPSPSITHTPVGIKLTGTKAQAADKPTIIKTPTSYLALSELIARLVDGKVFTAEVIDWPTLTQALPESAVVSENDNAIVMQYQGKYYIRLNGGDWVPYPQ